LRKSEQLYAELGLKDRKLDDDALIALMVENPILIERPIVVAGGKAAIGRPPEKILEIFYASRLRDGASSTSRPLPPRPKDFSRRITSQTGKTMTAPSRK